MSAEITEQYTDPTMVIHDDVTHSEPFASKLKWSAEINPLFEDLVDWETGSQFAFEEDPSKKPVFKKYGTEIDRLKEDLVLKTIPKDPHPRVLRSQKQYIAAKKSPETTAYPMGTEVLVFDNKKWNNGMVVNRGPNQVDIRFATDKGMQTKSFDYDDPYIQPMYEPFPETSKITMETTPSYGDLVDWDTSSVKRERFLEPYKKLNMPEKIPHGVVLASRARADPADRGYREVIKDEIKEHVAKKFGGGKRIRTPLVVLKEKQKNLKHIESIESQIKSLEKQLNSTKLTQHQMFLKQIELHKTKRKLNKILRGVDVSINAEFKKIYDKLDDLFKKIASGGAHVETVLDYVTIEHMLARKLNAYLLILEQWQQVFNKLQQVDDLTSGMPEKHRKIAELRGKIHQKIIDIRRLQKDIKRRIGGLDNLVVVKMLWILEVGISILKNFRATGAAKVPARIEDKKIEELIKSVHGDDEKKEDLREEKKIEPTSEVGVKGEIFEGDPDPTLVIHDDISHSEPFAPKLKWPDSGPSIFSQISKAGVILLSLMNSGWSALNLQNAPGVPMKTKIVSVGIYFLTALAFMGINLGGFSSIGSVLGLIMIGFHWFLRNQFKINQVHIIDIVVNLVAVLLAIFL